MKTSGEGQNMMSCIPVIPVIPVFPVFPVEVLHHARPYHHKSPYDS